MTALAPEAMQTERKKPLSQSLVPFLFLLHLVLLLPVLFPNLSDIGAFDESVYINSGRMLAQCSLPTLAQNPLVAVLYALTYLPVQSSTYWLIHSCTIGRLVLLALLWAASYLIAKRLSRYTPPLLILALLLVSPAIPTLLQNPSDALFAAMSGFGFWQILSFHQNRQTKHLWFASTFVGLAALARSDGLVLFPILILLSVILAISPKRTGAGILASLLPFVVLVGGYVLLYGAVTGRYQLGLNVRTYLAFEQGQGVAYSHQYEGNPFVEGQIEARRLFGTPEENQYSVLRAIRRNPGALLRRVAQTARILPGQILSVYGSLGIFLILFAARGLLVMLRKRQFLLICIFLLWPAHLLTYFVTFFRPGYFLLPYFVLFAAASIGITAISGNLSDKKERYSWYAVFLGLACHGALANNPSRFVIALVFLLGFIIVWLFQRQRLQGEASSESTRTASLILLACILLLAKENYPTPRFRQLGLAADEQATLFMEEHLEPGARVGSYAPSKVWIAKMSYMPMYLDLRYMKSDQDLLDWIEGKKLSAIYADKALQMYEPAVWALVEGQIGKSLQVAFTSTDETIRVLVVVP